MLIDGDKEPVGTVQRQRQQVYTSHDITSRQSSQPLITNSTTLYVAYFSCLSFHGI